MCSCSHSLEPGHVLGLWNELPCKDRSYELIEAGSVDNIKLAVSIDVPSGNGLAISSDVENEGVIAIHRHREVVVRLFARMDAEFPVANFAGINLLVPIVVDPNLVG